MELCSLKLPSFKYNFIRVFCVLKSSSNFLTTTNLQLLRPLPCIRILVDKIILEHSVPMYADQLVQYVSSLNQPSDNLLHYCYMHCYLKVCFIIFFCSVNNVGHPTGIFLVTQQEHITVYHIMGHWFQGIVNHAVLALFI